MNKTFILVLALLTFNNKTWANKTTDDGLAAIIKKSCITRELYLQSHTNRIRAQHDNKSMKIVANLAIANFDKHEKDKDFSYSEFKTTLKFYCDKFKTNGFLPYPVTGDSDKLHEVYTDTLQVVEDSCRDYFSLLNRNDSKTFGQNILDGFTGTVYSESDKIETAKKKLYESFKKVVSLSDKLAPDAEKESHEYEQQDAFFSRLKPICESKNPTYEAQVRGYNLVDGAASSQAANQGTNQGGR
jgi:hypothetical protein